MSNIQKQQSSLFDRVVSILEEARSNVVRAVNSNMVTAYWLIGREIVEEIQKGKKRAEYGKQVIEELSAKLQKRYKKGFSSSNLWYFRQFYSVYSDRLPILQPLGGESVLEAKIHPTGGFLVDSKKDHPPGAELTNTFPEKTEPVKQFSPQLTWSHYRALMRVNNNEARLFYEQEAITCGWNKRTLERHIHSQYYERMLKSQQPEAMLQAGRKAIQAYSPSVDILKNPYVLEFLDLPDSDILHETQLESAIITQLQEFLLELGKGFAFVGRQKLLRFNDTALYVDLVFYNCILKCYLLIDLKMGELSYQDVGQMDGYVRMFDELYTAEDDNPTIGLILCTEKNEAVARYSVLSERKQIFASKYMLYLPTEEELKIELQRERKLIEAHLEEGK